MHSTGYSTDQFGSLIDLIYDAAFDAAQWPVFLSRLADVLAGRMPSLFLHDTRTASGSLTVNVGWEPELVRSYNEYYSERNIWLRSRPDLLRPGIVRTSHMMCARHVFLASEWYADYCRPIGISQGIGATILKNADVTSNIVVMADARRDDYGPQDMALLKALLPHIQRALRAHSVLMEGDGKRRELEEALEHLATGVILVTHEASVVFMNAAARRMVGSRHGLIVDRAGITATAADEADTLKALIAQAARTSRGQGGQAGGTMRIGRRQGRSPLELTVSPIRMGEFSRTAARASAVIYVGDPDRAIGAAQHSFAQSYGLTRAEERVVMTILRSHGSMRRVAAELGVSYNTLKTQLKSVYAKTRTRGQAELIRLALSGVVPPDRP